MRLTFGFNIAVTAVAFSGLAAMPVLANSFQSLDAIDQAVMQFTGKRIGEAGGAQTRADRQLRLRSCRQPFGLSWHSPSHTAVRVTCPDAGGWRVFIPTLASTSAQSAPAARAIRAQKAQPVISRRDLLRVEAGGSGFRVSRQGEALENGAIGQTIRIRVVDGTRSGRIVNATIVEAGLARIPIG